jgi:hypothetical protein
MSILDAIASALDAAEAQGQTSLGIEIGTQQAHALADELNAHTRHWREPDPLADLLGVTLPPPPPLVTAEQILTEHGELFGVPVRGVEAPDFLRVGPVCSP